MEPYTPDELERYEEILAHDPTSQAFAQLADAYRRQGRYADAVAACDRGLQRYPNFVGARMILAHALVEQGDGARAEAEFRRILDQVPDDIPAHRALGDLLQGQGRTAEALAAYNALLDLTPLDREVVEVAETLRAPAPPLPGAADGVVPGMGEPPPGDTPEVPLFDLTEVAAAPPLPLGPPVGSRGVEGAGPTAALAAGDVWEPVGASGSAPRQGAAGEDGLAEALETWLAAARSLGAERSRR